MRSLGCALLFLAHAGMASAQADLQLASSATPSSGMWLDDEVVVSTTVRNMGPGAVGPIRVGFLGEADEIFYFHFVGSESPECRTDSLEIDPPIFNFDWTFPPLAAGEEHTCVMRLVVFNLPEDGTARLSGKIRIPAVDADASNNAVSVDLVFGSAEVIAPRTIPLDSPLALALATAATLVIGGIALAGNRRGGA